MLRQAEGWRTLTRVWQHPEYRALLLIKLLSGIAVSSYVPLISLFLVQTLGVDYAAVGLFTLTFLAAPIVGILVGRLSDRLPSRVPLILVIGVWAAVGRVVMSMAPDFGIALLVGVVFGAFSGVVNAQAFALLRDVVDRDGEEREATIASVVRTGYSLGWAIGPLLGAATAAGFG